MHRSTRAIKNTFEPRYSLLDRSPGGRRSLLSFQVPAFLFFSFRCVPFLASVRSIRQPNSSSWDPEANRSHDRLSLHPGKGRCFVSIVCLIRLVAIRLTSTVSGHSSTLYTFRRVLRDRSNRNPRLAIRISDRGWSWPLGIKNNLACLFCFFFFFRLRCLWWLGDRRPSRTEGPS